MKGAVIERLNSGGLMTNYYCSSRCRHCLYFCSPFWTKEYIDEAATDSVLSSVRRMGCYSVHIGGGEPFLDHEGLLKVLAVFKQARMGLDYVETNCSWYTNRKTAVNRLKELRQAGLNTILVSISPFHNEYIPLNKTLGVIQAAGEAGIGIFPWVERFLSDLQQFGPSKPHTLEQYEERFGDGYIENLPRNYWITMRGRALETYSRFMEPKPLSRLLAENSGGCYELFETSHFHIDLYGNYIPGLCTGLSVEHTDLGSPIDSDKYPFLFLLMKKGTDGLLSHVQEKYGFTPEDSYVSKCQLCYSIRRYLVVEKNIHSADLQPEQYYTAGDPN